MSAMVGNFVHKVRSYRVLEAPDWPKLIRNAAISEADVPGSWSTQHTATLASKGAARSTTARALCLAFFLTYAPLFCPFSHSASSPGALGNVPRQVRRVTDEVTTTAPRGPSARHATSIAASSAELGAASFSARRNAQTPPPPLARLSSSSPPLLSRQKAPPALLWTGLMAPA